ncbi:hypothetical protein Tco_1126079, partial [Tanacetum coccineum]
MDSNLSQLPVSTPMDTRMHKEDQQANGGPTSLGVTSEARVNPQLSSGMLAFNLNECIYSASFIIHSESASGNDALAASTTEADPGNSAPSIDLHVLTDQTTSVNLAKLVSHVKPSFKVLDSPEDDPVIIVADSDEDKDDEVHATENVETEDTSVPKSSSPSSTLLSQYGTSKRAASKVLKIEFSNILFAHDFSSSLPTELKDLSSKFDELT